MVRPPRREQDKCSSETFRNDVMLLKLGSPAFSPYIKLGQFNTLPKHADAVTVVGLGALEHIQISYRQQMFESRDHSECGKNYKDLLGVPVDKNRALSAGTRDGIRDACQGDSGGPLVDKDGLHIVWMRLCPRCNARCLCANHHWPTPWRLDCQTCLRHDKAQCGVLLGSTWLSTANIPTITTKPRLKRQGPYQRPIPT